MATNEMVKKDDDGVAWLMIPLDGETAERLEEFARACCAQPVQIAASLLHDMLKDDDEAHKHPADFPAHAKYH